MSTDIETGGGAVVQNLEHLIHRTTHGDIDAIVSALLQPGTSADGALMTLTSLLYYGGRVAARQHGLGEAETVRDALQQAGLWGDGFLQGLTAALAHPSEAAFIRPRLRDRILGETNADVTLAAVTARVIEHLAGQVSP